MTKKNKQVSHSIYYEFTDEEKREYVNYIKNKIVRGKNKQPLFADMMEIVKRKVERFEPDFYVHDINAFTIETFGCSKFIWNVYDCGSKLVRLENEFEEDMEASWMYFDALSKNYMGEGTENYLVDLKNNQLVKINPKQITKNDFSNQFGKAEDYFHKKAEQFGFVTYPNLKSQFNDLMRKYKKYPPKSEVDKIFNIKNIKKAM